MTLGTMHRIGWFGFGQWTSAGATEDRSLKVMVFVSEACGNEILTCHRS